MYFIQYIIVNYIIGAKISHLYLYLYLYNTAKITQDWPKAEGPLVPWDLASQLKRLWSLGLIPVERSWEKGQ